MLLAVDIGNTNITLGVFKDDELLLTKRLVTDINKTSEEYATLIAEKLKNVFITKAVIASVVDELNIIVKNACDNVFGVDSFLFNTTSKTGVVLDVANPELVGADRVANAYAAAKLYSLPCIIVDSGSATTFDIVSSDKRFFGGIIMPGINMQLNSLCEKTSKLPKIEPEEIESVIGVDTKTCILSGVIRGHACAIEGLIKECEEEMNQKCTIIATGGIAKLVSKYMKRDFDYINQDLTLQGIKFLYELNQG